MVTKPAYPKKVMLSSAKKMIKNIVFFDIQPPALMYLQRYNKNMHSGKAAGVVGGERLQGRFPAHMQAVAGLPFGCRSYGLPLPGYYSCRTAEVIMHKTICNIVANNT
jgi:hypothetical protein